MTIKQLHEHGPPEIPDAPAVQLGIFDRFVDRQQIANDVGVEALSERGVLRAVEGSDRSGQRRKRFSNELDVIMLAFWHSALKLYGHEVAVLVTFHVVARAPGYLETAPRWMRRLFEENKPLLVHAFYRDGDRRVEPASPDDE